MKARVVEMSKTTIKITGIKRDPRTGMVINTEEVMDALYRYLVKRWGRKAGRVTKR